MVRADVFDPYHKWLGIPPQDQPADPYRLLGIARFEEDHEVILAAADRQMSHIRTFQNGAFAGAAQALLTEIAAAKLALLSEGQRQIVDKLLKQQIMPQPPAPAPQKPPFVWAPPANNPVALPQRRRRSALSTLFGLLVLIGIISAFVATVYVIVTQWDQISAAKPGITKNTLPQGVPTSGPVASAPATATNDDNSIASSGSATIKRGTIDLDSNSPLTDPEQEIIDYSRLATTRNQTGSSDAPSAEASPSGSTVRGQEGVSVPPQLRPHGSPAPIPESTMVDLADCWNRSRQQYEIESYASSRGMSILVEEAAPGLGEVSIGAQLSRVTIGKPFSLEFADCADVKLDVVIRRDPKSLTDGYVAIVNAVYLATNGKSTPLTQNGIVKVTRLAKRDYDDFLGRLGNSIQEHSATKAWLEAPLGRPPAQKNAAISRLAELENLITVARSEAPKYEAEIARLEAIRNFVENECWIKLRIQ